MEITSEHLRAEIDNLRTQQANALAVVQQAIGAITLCESLLVRLEQKDHLTLSELKDSVGAASISIEEHKGA